MFRLSVFIGTTARLWSSFLRILVEPWGKGKTEMASKLWLWNPWRRTTRYSVMQLETDAVAVSVSIYTFVLVFPRLNNLRNINWRICLAVNQQNSTAGTKWNRRTNLFFYLSTKCCSTVPLLVRSSELCSSLNYARWRQDDVFTEKKPIHKHAHGYTLVAIDFHSHRIPVMAVLKGWLVRPNAS